MSDGPDAPPPSYAVGVRRPLSTAPAEVFAVVAELLAERWDEPVASITDVRGGMAPGCAAAVRGPSGAGVFVKAVGSSVNPRNVELYRDEARWGARLPALPGIVRPLASRDVLVPAASGGPGPDDWVVTSFPLVEGAPPAHPWRAGDLTRVLDAWWPLAEAFTPSPFADVSPDGLAGFFVGWAMIGDDPQDPWHALAGDWVGHERDLSDAIHRGDTFTHSDLRADNLLIDRTGGVHVIDWVHAMRGPRWIDPAILMGDVVASGADRSAGGDVDVAAVWAHPVFDGATREQLVAALGCYAGIMHALSRRPAPPGLPTIRSWQHVQAEAVMAWVLGRGGDG